MTTRNINVVFFKDGQFWLGVCTDLMVFAEERSLDGARESFAKVLRDQLFLCEHFGINVDDTGKAEQRYADLFESGKDIGTREVGQYTLHERSAN